MAMWKIIALQEKVLVFPLSSLDVWTLACSSKGLQEQAERLLCVITGAQVKYAHCCRDFAETYDFMAKVEWILWGPNIFMKRNPMRDNSFLLFSRATRAHIGTICCTLGFLVRNPPAPAKVCSINSLILWGPQVIICNNIILPTQALNLCCIW